jgi:hypothetical protein
VQRKRAHDAMAKLREDAGFRALGVQARAARIQQ